MCMACVAYCGAVGVMLSLCAVSSQWHRVEEARSVCLSAMSDVREEMSQLDNLMDSDDFTQAMTVNATQVHDTGTITSFRHSVSRARRIVVPTMCDIRFTDRDLAVKRNAPKRFANMVHLRHADVLRTMMDMVDSLKIPVREVFR